MRGAHLQTLPALWASSASRVAAPTSVVGRALASAGLQSRPSVWRSTASGTKVPRWLKPALHANLRNRTRRGQALVEYALTWVGLFFPLTAMLIFTAQMLWVWHSVVDMTRDGARYAATHCYQGGGANVVSWMRQNTPIMVDREQFVQGAAQIDVSYFSKNADSGVLEEFACTGSDCSKDCVPDAVRVRVLGYQFNGILSYLGLAPISLPDFQTIVPIESAGCDPDQETCLP
ncbi:MAG: TadE family protein [Bryobacteraceae bacterium]